MHESYNEERLRRLIRRRDNAQFLREEHRKAGREGMEQEWAEQVESLEAQISALRAVLGKPR